PAAGPLRDELPRRGLCRKALEVVGEVAGRLEALRRRLFEAVTDEPFESGRKAPVGLGQIRRGLLQDRGHRLYRRVAAKRAAAGEHLVEDRAEGEDVAAMVR